MRVETLLDAIRKGKTLGYTGEWNLAEFYYKTCEKLGRDTAELRHTSLRNSKVNVVRPDENLTRLAGEYKCKYRSALSLADAYVLAATESLGAKLITTDSALARLKVVPVELLQLPTRAS